MLVVRDLARPIVHGLLSKLCDVSTNVCSCTCAAGNSCTSRSTLSLSSQPLVKICSCASCEARERRTTSQLCSTLQAPMLLSPRSVLVFPTSARVTGTPLLLHLKAFRTTHWARSTGTKARPKTSFASQGKATGRNVVEAFVGCVCAFFQRKKAEACRGSRWRRNLLPTPCSTVPEKSHFPPPLSPNILPAPEGPIQSAPTCPPRNRIRKRFFFLVVFGRFWSFLSFLVVLVKFGGDRIYRRRGGL